MAQRTHARGKRFFRSRLFYFLCFTAISIIGYLVFYAYPFVRTIVLSFTNKKAAFKEFDWVGFDNFKRIFKYENLFPKALANSLIYAIFSGIITLFLALASALLLNNKIKFVGVFRVILFLPFVIPTFAAAAMFKGLFDPNVGIINQTLYDLFHIQGPGWFKSENTALLTMILMSIWGFGVQMLIFLAALQNVPRELYEAIEIDGGGYWAGFFHITLPCISPMLFLNIILVSINGLKSFNAGFLISAESGDPNYSTLLLPVLIYRIAFSSADSYRLGYASALAWIYFGVIMIFTAVQFLLSKFYVKNDME